MVFMKANGNAIGWVFEYLREMKNNIENNFSVLSMSQNCITTYDLGYRVAISS